MTANSYSLTSLASVLVAIVNAFAVILMWVVGTLAIAALATLAFDIWRRLAERRQSARHETAVAPRPPHARRASRRMRARSASARSIISAWLAVTAVVVALACSSSGSANNPQMKASVPPVVTITATDYAYDAPDTVAAGVNVFRMVNRGHQPHMATIVRLEAGRTLRDYLAAYAEAQRINGPRPTWAQFRGGPAALLSGSEGNATIHLEPGNYAWVCFVPVPDGVSHLLKHHQAHAFVVRPRTGDTPAPGAPAPTISLRMLDYGFQFSAPLKAGTHIIRVENAGADYHHVLMFKLAPGKTMADYQSWLKKNMQGEAPATFVGAMAEQSPGTDAFLELNLAAGEYALVCLISGRDEVPHVDKGMIQIVRVD